MAADGSNPYIIGTMHDDGLNGDVTANDHIYSFQLAINDPVAQSLYYRVSAAFKGSLTRVLSGLVVVNVQNQTPLAVPNVTGLSQAAATTAITEAGLNLGAITTVASKSVATGNVISQSPSAAALVAPGSLVSLVISTGTPPIAQGTLAAGVVVLTAAQLAQVISETPFNGTISLPPGTVFLTANNAFYALNTTVTSTQTMVSVEAAAIEQVFSSLQVAGTYTVTPADAVPSSVGGVTIQPAGVGERNLASPADGTTTLPVPINYSIGTSISAQGSLNTTMSVDFATRVPLPARRATSTFPPEARVP